MTWNTGKPDKHGYYLGAWKRGDQWVVSELWYNPSSFGTGWWNGRGYFHQDCTTGTEPMNVVAWMPMPFYSPERVQEGLDHDTRTIRQGSPSSPSGSS